MDWLIVGIMLILITVLVFIFFEIKTEGTLCYSNPLQYGAGYYSDVAKDELSCTCSFQGKNFIPFVVTRNSTKPLTALGGGSDEIIWPILNLSKFPKTE